MGDDKAAKKCTTIFRVKERGGVIMAEKTYIEAEKVPKKEALKESIGSQKQFQENINTNIVPEDSFIYIGPTLKTGLVENTIFYGKRAKIEEHLKDTLDEFPQVKYLLVTTKNLAASKEKVKKTGTLLNKYYNDILSLSRHEEG